MIKNNTFKFVKIDTEVYYIKYGMNVRTTNLRKHSHCQHMLA